MKRLQIPALCILFLSCGLFGLERYSLGGNDFYLDPPLSWSLIEYTGTKLTLSSSDGNAFFQMKSEARENRALSEIAEDVFTTMGGSGEGVGYSFHTKPAWFGLFDFVHQEIPYKSYLLLLEEGDSVFILIGFSPDAFFHQYNDYIISCLDSFYPQDFLHLYSGPIASFDRFFSGKEMENVEIRLPDRTETLPMDLGGIESSRFVIDREARILAQEGSIPSWKRFYRIIFSDTYQDIAAIGAFLRPSVGSLSDLELTAYLLRWVQDFSYARSGTLADIHAPLVAIAEGTGDCDTRSLILLALLHYFDIDAILLVSTVYMHGLVGVDLQWQGARFEYRSVPYLIAETTERVDLGLIASDMANPDNWIPIELWSLDEFDQ